MARYIDADAIHKFVDEKVAEGKDGWKNGVPYEWAYALTIIDNAPTADVAPRAEWISVRERLPDGNGVFLVSLKESGYENLVYFDVRPYADGDWRNLPDKFTVSHWMPLPEPPKGD